MYSIMLILILLGVSLVHGFDTVNMNDDAVREICGREPADVVFILDESTSIYFRDFDKEKAFVKEVATLFELDKGNIKVGIMTFATEPIIRFNLGSINTLAELNDDVDSVKQTRGETYTADAINLAVTDMFHKHARPGIPHTIILITDGESIDTARTAQAAFEARDEGITIFALGVGMSVNEEELVLIASSPASDYVYQVNNFNELSRVIGNSLAYKTCIITTSAPPTTTTTLPQMIEGCNGHQPLDLIFALPDDSLPQEQESYNQFIRKIVSRTEMAANRVQVGVTPHMCDYIGGIRLNENDELENFMATLDGRNSRPVFTEKHLRYMYTTGYLPENGGRPRAVRAGVLIVDGSSSDKRTTLQEATRAKDEGIDLIVVAIGNVDQSEVEHIASNEQNVFRVDNYGQLNSQVDGIVSRLCKALLAGETGEYDYYNNV